MSELDNVIKRLKENADNKELPYMIADIIKKNCSQNEINLILQNLKEYDNTNPSEDLKTIDEIRTKHTKYHTNEIASGTIELDEAYFFSLIHIAKSSIKKLEQIEEDKKISPNEQALECLQTLKVIHNLNAPAFPKSYEYCNIIKDALTYKSKKELAFDIIKEKNVDIGLLRLCSTVDIYNIERHDIFINGKLNQEEFELIKEVVK